MKLVHVSIDQHVMTISLSRPDVRNAFNPQMIKELKDGFHQASQNSQVRAVLLKGEGKIFCAGGDLNWMKDMVSYSQEENRQDSLQLFEMFEAIMNCPLPVIAAVQGAAFGGALGLIACADYVVAEQKTQFCFSEVKLGIAPAVISAFVLKKCSLGSVGPMMLSGHVFHAADALRMGLIHCVCEEELLSDQVYTALKWFKETGPQATRRTKTLLRDLQMQSWSEQKEAVTSAIAQLRVSSEGQEGLKSFLEKRTPSWRLN